MTDLEQSILSLIDRGLRAKQIAEHLSCSTSTVYRCAAQHGADLKTRKKPKQKNNLTERIRHLSDGVATAAQIAAELGCSEKYVQNIQRTHGMCRLRRGARNGELNSAYVGGRRVDHDGYVLVSVGVDHPYARHLDAKGYKVMYEHRLVVERNLGRHLLPSEIVDHVDGLHLHNHPSNLRLFQSNADHLKRTISGQRPEWSADGFSRMKTPPAQRVNLERIDTYRQRKRCGDVRLQQILLAAFSLGIDSPFLLGTLHHLDKAGIDYSSRQKIERALVDLSEKWASPQTR